RNVPAAVVPRRSRARALPARVSDRRSRLEWLQSCVFLLQSGTKSLTRAQPFRTTDPMIICSCNVFSDEEVRTALVGSRVLPRTAGEVYDCLGCSPQCGRCARTIRRIMDEALGAGYPAAPGEARQGGDFGPEPAPSAA